jgi:hypothetical protein
MLGCSEIDLNFIDKITCPGVRAYDYSSYNHYSFVWAHLLHASPILIGTKTRVAVIIIPILVNDSESLAIPLRPWQVHPKLRLSNFSSSYTSTHAPSSPFPNIMCNTDRGQSKGRYSVQRRLDVTAWKSKPGE